MYAITVALNHQEIGDHPERTSKKLLNHTSKYNWKNINFPSQIKDWETFEKNNDDIAFNILSLPYGKKKQLSCNTSQNIIIQEEIK